MPETPFRPSATPHARGLPADNSFNPTGSAAFYAKSKHSRNINRIPLSLSLVLLGVCVSAATPKPFDWPQWQGPDRNANSRETGLLKTWPKNGPPLAWRITGVGGGYSAVARLRPIGMARALFVTALAQALVLAAVLISLILRNPQVSSWTTPELRGVGRNAVLVLLFAWSGLLFRKAGHEGAATGASG